MGWGSYDRLQRAFRVASAPLGLPASWSRHSRPSGVANEVQLTSNLLRTQFSTLPSTRADELNYSIQARQQTMGTLTADCPRLDAHCPHKLATSCRLTSTPNCCACADDRAHSRTYKVYIDGIGFVQRGTRWQGYCWFCKEFWTNRLAATDPPLDIAQTRVPEIPDQTEFLERWFEFHQGYRIARLQDGTEQRMSVIAEPLKEVSPGFLPRTLHQLREGVENNARRPENRLRRRRLSSEEERPEEPQQSLEAALDSLLAEVSDDETPRPLQETAPPVVDTPQPTAATPEAQPRPMNRGEARLQRARERFARTFGTREEIQHEDYESPLSTMYNRAFDRYQQAEERRATDTTAPPPLDGLSVQERREIEDQLLWGVMRDSAASHELEVEDTVWSYAPRRAQVATEDLTDAVDRSLAQRLAAVSPQLEAMSPRLESATSPRLSDAGSTRLGAAGPDDANIRALAEVFERLEADESNRFRLGDEAASYETWRHEALIAAQARRNRSRSPATSARLRTFTASSNPPTTSTAGSSRTPIASGPLFEFGQPRSAATRDRPYRTNDLERLRRQFDVMEAEERRNSQAQASSSTADARPSSSGGGMSQIQTSISQITSELQRLRLASEAITSARHSMHARTERPELTLDNQPDRPEPQTDEEMTKTLACQVCYQQLANVALLPCGHMVMCQWCADVVIPVKHSHLPIRPSKCPMCRKMVKQRFKIHM
jgi:hypothetical protein